MQIGSYCPLSVWDLPGHTNGCFFIMRMGVKQLSQYTATAGGFNAVTLLVGQWSPLNTGISTWLKTSSVWGRIWDKRPFQMSQMKTGQLHHNPTKATLSLTIPPVSFILSFNTFLLSDLETFLCFVLFWPSIAASLSYRTRKYYFAEAGPLVGITGLDREILGQRAFVWQRGRWKIQLIKYSDTETNIHHRISQNSWYIAIQTQRIHCGPRVNDNTVQKQ